MSKLFVQKLQPMLEKGLSKPANLRELKNKVGHYIDKNVDHFTTPGPDTRPVFTEEDRKVLYDACEIDVVDVKAFLKSHPGIKAGWMIMNDPFNSVAAVAIRYFTMKNNKEMTAILRMYLMYSMYPSIHYKFFNFNPSKPIMDYTINNMSNKFKVKQAGTIGHALQETVEGSYTHHRQRLIKGDDKDVVDFVMDVKTRINSLIKNIAREYYMNHENKNYMNANSDDFDPDSYHETDSNMYAIERITNKVTMRLVTNGPNLNMVNMAAKWCKVSTNELRNYTNQLVSGKYQDDIHDIIESVLYLYLYDSQNSAEDISHNTKFLTYCFETYKKSNTTNKNIIKIKQILDKWLEDVGTYKKTQRVATINDFRRALYLFFVISIMNYA